MSSEAEWEEKMRQHMPQAYESSRARERPVKRLPVTILTGFLGSGKTTLLNQLLLEEHGKRIAVIENEFGEIGVDGDLVLSSEGVEVIEMNNRCICCPARAGEEVRLDLIRILGALAERKEELDYVVIETTGLANPGPIVQTFFLHDGVKEHFQLDGVATMVDVSNALQQLEKTPEAKEQVAFADRLIVNKTDLSSTEQLQEVTSSLQCINPTAEIVTAEPFASSVGIASILDIQAFSLSRVLQSRPGFLEETQHSHDPTISSIGLTTRLPLDSDKVQTWLSKLLHVRGEDILRSKGLLYLKGSTRQFVFQGVHTLFDGDVGRLWRHSEQKESRIVMIGRNLDRSSLEQSLHDCIAD